LAAPPSQHICNLKRARRRYAAATASNYIYVD